MQVICQSNKLDTIQIKTGKTQDQINNNGGKNENQKEEKKRQDKQISNVVIPLESSFRSHNMSRRIHELI